MADELARLTGALLDRLTDHVHILEMNGDSYRLKSSRKKKDPGGANRAFSLGRRYGGGLHSALIARPPASQGYATAAPIS